MLGDKLYSARQNSAVCFVLHMLYMHTLWRVNIYWRRNLNFALGFGRNIVPCNRKRKYLLPVHDLMEYQHSMPLVSSFIYLPFDKLDVNMRAVCINFLLNPVMD
jgi:hypothetical protein